MMRLIHYVIRHVRLPWPWCQLYPDHDRIEPYEPGENIAAGLVPDDYDVKCKTYAPNEIEQWCIDNGIIVGTLFGGRVSLINFPKDSASHFAFKMRFL